MKTSMDHTTSWYLIAATPRTGSKLLCQDLRAVKAVGAPSEFLAPRYRQRLKSSWDFDQGSGADDLDYLREVYSRTNTAGLAGIKVMRSHWNGISEEAREWVTSSSGFRIVYVERGDKHAQAISWMRAIQTQAWSDGDGGSVVSKYDEDLLFEIVGWLKEAAVYWEDRLRVFPSKRVLYEDLMGNAEAIASVVRFVTQREITEVEIDAVRADRDSGLRTQRDKQSELWTKRLRADLPNL